MKKYFVSVVMCALAATQCFGWGQKGHDVTCAIAQRHLSEASKAMIQDLFEGRSMIYWCNWLDNASHTPEYAYTKTWHYKNIDADQQYDDVEPLPTGNIVTALTSQTQILKDYLAAQRKGKKSKVSRDEAVLALKIVVHLVGDIHQPMHMGHKSDIGGNRWQVQFFSEGTNVHSVWDSPLLESGHKWSYTEWADELDRGLVDEEQVVGGSFDDWGRETWCITCDIYDQTPVGTKISYDYVARWTPIVEQQLLRGGLRLAHLLNNL